MPTHMPTHTTEWVSVICAISTHGNGCARGSTAYSPRMCGDSDENRRKMRRKVTEDYRLSDDLPAALRECTNFKNNCCAHGVRCIFSHAPCRPFTDGDYVNAEVYFKSVDYDDLSKEHVWKLAQQFGKVTDIVFYDHNPHMVAGKIFMTNREAAYALAHELNYKTFINYNRTQQKRYTMAHVQRVTVAEQPFKMEEKFKKLCAQSNDEKGWKTVTKSSKTRRLVVMPFEACAKEFITTEANKSVENMDNDSDCQSDCQSDCESVHHSYYIYMAKAILSKKWIARFKHLIQPTEMLGY